MLVVERWILMTLRKRTSFSLGVVNEAGGELLTRLNARSFRKQEGSRQTLFDMLDRPALQPLPSERYSYGEWKTARVNIDYHIEFDRHWHSVPYQLTHREVEICASASTIEISTMVNESPVICALRWRGGSRRHGNTGREHISGIWIGHLHECWNGSARSVHP
jgi:hypothetical protein